MSLYFCLLCFPVIIFFLSVLFVVCFFVFIMGLFITALSDFGSVIICSGLLVVWFLLFVDFISELIYVVS